MLRQFLLRKTVPFVTSGQLRSNASLASALPASHEFTLLIKFKQNFNPVGETQRFIAHPQVSFLGQITERETQWGPQKEQAWCLACMAPSLEIAKEIVENDAALSKHIDSVEGWALQTVHTSAL